MPPLYDYDVTFRHPNGDAITLLVVDCESEKQAIEQARLTLWRTFSVPFSVRRQLTVTTSIVGSSRWLV